MGSHLIDEGGDDIGFCHVGNLRFGGQSDTVFEHGDGDFFDIVGNDERPAFDRREDATAFDKGDASPGAAAPLDHGMLTGCVDDAGDVGQEAVIDSNALQFRVDEVALHRESRDLVRAGWQDALDNAFENIGFDLRLCMIDFEFEQEAIELGFGQGKGALKFSRVLRGHDEKVGT